MEPVRTCVGCRARAEKSSLLRVVAQNSILVVDETATLPGRGAYLHETAACFQNAVKRRAFGRALRIESSTGSPLDTANLQTRLNGIVNN
ncbi:YlxR family protein [Subtercola endophyticus]|uniref:YlxR family protein n=1 Tax=Subtercola endophyticus TaxID=2895559 RepID=UPI001E3EDA36|nr:YlxR family protein [Subtercola endophyticus]UFS60086.1 YlxR family protein [Subtercola endophyticus]